MGCTAGCLNISLNDEKHMELFAETFIEVMNEELYEPFEDINDVLELFDTNGDIMFTLDAEPIFSFGHGWECVQDFLLEFLKKAPDASLSGDYFSDWDNCCDECIMQFEYENNKLSIMRIFAEISTVECPGCGEEIELSDVEIDFKKEDRCLVCPECGAKLPLHGEKDCCSVFIDDIMMEDGEWVLPEGFEFGDCDTEESDETEDAEEENVTADEAPAEVIAEPEQTEKAINKKKRKWWIILFAIAVLALGAAIGQYLEICDIIGFIKNLI